MAYKTQVFVPNEDDHFRTRLTHTIEVSQISRALARGLCLNADLAETLALAHDLGHTPFGHTGEEALDACLSSYGGFDHNSQTLRIVTDLERRYAAFDGLNLTWESLEGLVKHNGPLLEASGLPTLRYRKRGVPPSILAYDRKHSLALALQPSAEAQCAAVADDIAYNAHDIDDGLRAGLFALADLREVHFLDALITEVWRLHPGLEAMRAVHEVGRRIITGFVEDAISESNRRLSEAEPRCADDVRAAAVALVGFSVPMQTADSAIKAFLMPRMYRHPRVLRERQAADRVVQGLFGHFMANSADLPASWAASAGKNEDSRARTVADFIAGMTDRQALQRYELIFDETLALR